MPDCANGSCKQATVALAVGTPVTTMRMIMMTVTEARMATVTAMMMTMAVMRTTKPGY